MTTGVSAYDVLDNEIKDLEFKLGRLKEARDILAPNAELKPRRNPIRRNVTIESKRIYRTEKDKLYLEGVIKNALEGVKRPKDALWIFNNTRKLQGLKTSQGIHIVAKRMDEEGKIKGIKNGTHWTFCPVRSEGETVSIHLGHGTGKSTQGNE